MRKGDWWVKKGMLASDESWNSQIAETIKQFPRKVPRVFMTGDGHRNPPFTWTGQNFFQSLVQDVGNKICCHVEEQPDGVKEHSVPAQLNGVIKQKKLFGWEAPIYNEILEILRPLLDLLGAETIEKKVLVDLKKRMGNLVGKGYLVKEGNDFIQFCLAADKYPQAKVPVNQFAFIENTWQLDDTKNLVKQKENFTKVLLDYNNAAMNFRTNPKIHFINASNIQTCIDRYSDHIHVIACGDAHIIAAPESNPIPLYEFIHLPEGVFGIADAM